MGFSLEWLAIKDASADQVCAALGVERTGAFGDALSAPIMGVALPSGHYLVLVDDRSREVVMLHDSFVDDPGLENEVLSFACNDGIMMTALQSWTNGNCNWIVSRWEPNEDCELEGPVPEAFHEINAKLQAKQQNSQDADYIYDATAELGKALTGFRHDEAFDDPTLRFEVLRLRPDSRFRIPSRSNAPQSGGTPRSSATPRGKPWWKFW